LAAAIAATMLYRFPPDRYAFYPPCPFHAFTGWDCPGCGTTRAIAAMLHGDLLRAFSLNPLLPLFMLILCLTWLFRERIQRHETVTVVGLVCFVVLSTAARHLLHF
jgi:hypothetical protein